MSTGYFSNSIGSSIPTGSRFFPFVVGGPIHFLMGLTFGPEIRPKLEDWVLKLGGVSSWVRITKILREDDVALTPLQFFVPWTWTLV